MSIFFTGGDEVATTVARLRALADDLERMAMFQPSAELAGAPIVSHWSWTSRKTSALAGFVEGHPILDSKFIVTSEVFAIDRQRGWARTFSRFYRLGPALPLPKEPAHV